MDAEVDFISHCREVFSLSAVLLFCVVQSLPHDIIRGAFSWTAANAEEFYFFAHVVHLLVIITQVCQIVYDTEDRLELSAETKHEEKKEEKGYVYRERRSGSYYRAISLPSPVDPDKSKASYKNGVLEIKMQKTGVKKKTPLKIE